MPELPEVETVVKTLRPLMVNKTVKDIQIFHAAMVKPNVEEFKKALIGKSIQSIQRLGKFILLFFTNDIVVISHLRMEGKYIEAENASIPLSRFARLVFVFENGTRLIYDDMRKFGTFELTNQATYLQHPSLRSLGQEPIHALDPKPIHQLFHHANRPIKSLLLDQRILLGIGNIYADEILYASKIHPLTLGRDLSLTQTSTILKHAREILNQAIEDGGTRIRTYASGQKIDGEFITKIKVYGKTGKVCIRCHHRIDKVIVGGRGTHYCPRCQHHPQFPFVIGVTGEIATGKSTLLQVGKSLGIPSIEADTLVHAFYQTKSAVQFLKKIFPESIVKEKIDRAILLKQMLINPKRYEQWIKILFPIIKKTIYEKLLKSKAKVILLEVPLLFQGEIDAFTDVVVGVESTRAMQLKRLKRRNPSTADALIVLNERNQYRDYLSFVDERLVNIHNLTTWKKLVKKTLYVYLKKI